jgi:hypothetical protein
MLQQKRTHLSSDENSGFIFIQNIWAKEEAESEGDAPLDDTARTEREYVRGRLQEELKREPTEQEVDEWLRQHTEGY